MSNKSKFKNLLSKFSVFVVFLLSGKLPQHYISRVYKLSISKFRLALAPEEYFFLVNKAYPDEMLYLFCNISSGSWLLSKVLV